MAGTLHWLTLLLTHPLEFWTLIQYAIYHDQKRDIEAEEEHATSGWDRESMRRSWAFLDDAGRSFSAVIKELEGDLARVVCLFYLVLRGLDTIEDDMTISDNVKQPLLRNFHVHTVTPGWTFDGNGPAEKDRQLLVEYKYVIDELNRLPHEYKQVIVDICQKMETGMADYAHKAATTDSIYLATVEEYELYCHYVAGLVGEGLSGIFSASGKEAPWLANQLSLSNSMGLFLQKTNIIRDYREDLEQNRYFWPKEIWGKFGFEHMKEMHLPGNEARASHAQTAMILDALRHATDALEYLKTLKNQSVFKFCAIPQAMAIASLELCFMNPAMFQRNVKIRRAEAAKLIMRATNPREVATIFIESAQRIHNKVKPSDPSFIRVSVACGQIEQWREHNYPSFIHIGEAGVKHTVSYNSADARTKIFNAEILADQHLASRGQVENIMQASSDEREYKPPAEAMTYTEMMAAVMLFCIGSVFIVLYFTGDLQELLPAAWSADSHVEL